MCHGIYNNIFDTCCGSGRIRLHLLSHRRAPRVSHRLAVPQACGTSFRRSNPAASSYIYELASAVEALVSSFAEAGGFEPPIRLPVYRISSAAHSTTLARFLAFNKL